MALCVSDKRRYCIGFLVPEVLAIDVGNQRTGIKDNHRLTHGWLGVVFVIVLHGQARRPLNTQLP